MKKLIKLSQVIAAKAQKNVNPYLHLVFGWLHNVTVIIFTALICIKAFNLYYSTTVLISLIACMPLLILFERAQKKQGGTNSFKKLWRSITNISEFCC